MLMKCMKENTKRYYLLALFITKLEKIVNKIVIL